MRTHSHPDQLTQYGKLAARFDAPGVRAIVLMGSRARDDGGAFSDVDLVRFLDRDTDTDVSGAGTHLVHLSTGRPGRKPTDATLVVVGDVTPTATERWFTDPATATNVIAGVRQAQPLVDRAGFFAEIQARAHAFTWNAALQAAANRWAGAEMVGWIEEAHKGLEGLRRSGHTPDTGRLLQARFGLSWGLSRVMQVQKGVLIAGDNDFFAAVKQAVGAESTWSRLQTAAFGLDGTDLPTTVRAGLQLYCETAHLIGDQLPAETRPLIAATVALISRELTAAPPIIDNYLYASRS